MELQQHTLRSFRSSKAFITFVIAYAVFTDQFLFAAIIPVYPYSLKERVHVAQDRVQFWVAMLMAIFGIACVITSIPWGLYTDHSKSRRWPFSIGLAILLGATLLLWFMNSIPGQIIGRALQGFSSIVVWTSGLAILVDTVGHDHISEAMGHIGMALNAGSLVAPCVGGIIFAKAGYHAVFGLIIGVILLDIILRFVMVERNPRYEQALELDGVDLGEVGSIDSRTGAQKTEPSVSQTSSIDKQADLKPRPSSGFLMHPIIRLLCSARFIAALWGFMVLATVFSGFQATLPLFVRDTFHWDAVGGGLIFVPLSVPSFLGPIVGRFTDRHGGRWFALSGFLLFAASLFLLRFVEHNTTSQKALLCALLVLVGSCMALILEPLFKEITYGATRLAEEDEKEGFDSKLGYFGTAYAWFNIAWCSGNYLGPLAAGMIMGSHGWVTMSWVLCLLSGVSAIPVGLYCGGWYFTKPK